MIISLSEVPLLWGLGIRLFADVLFRSWAEGFMGWNGREAAGIGCFRLRAGKS